MLNVWLILIPILTNGAGDARQEGELEEYVSCFLIGQLDIFFELVGCLVTCLEIIVKECDHVLRLW